MTVAYFNDGRLAFQTNYIKLPRHSGGLSLGASKALATPLAAH